MKLNNQKKGQAAVEFLTTYGWAIMVVIGMVAVMSYYGITDTDRLINEQCNAPTGFVCEGFNIETQGYNSTLQLRFKNNLGYDITIIDSGMPEGQSVVSTENGLIKSTTDDNFYNVTRGSISSEASDSGLFGDDMFDVIVLGNGQSPAANENIEYVNFVEGTTERVFVDVYYYRTRSGINFNKKATFELIGEIR